MQLQTELREPLTEIAQELFGVTEILESDDEVIGEPHDNYVASGAPCPPSTNPLIEYIVKIDVGEHRRRHASGNVAKRLPEFSITIPRSRLRPALHTGLL
jgi:hypothetical protein